MDFHLQSEKHESQPCIVCASDAGYWCGCLWTVLNCLLRSRSTGGCEGEVANLAPHLTAWSPAGLIGFSVNNIPARAGLWGASKLCSFSSGSTIMLVCLPPQCTQSIIAPDLQQFVKLHCKLADGNEQGEKQRDKIECPPKRCYYYLIPMISLVWLTAWIHTHSWISLTEWVVKCVMGEVSNSQSEGRSGTSINQLCYCTQDNFKLFPKQVIPDTK